MSGGDRLDARDIDHLRWLAILHYVMGGLLCLAGCLPIPHVAIFGSQVLSSSGAEDALVALMFLAVGFTLMLGFWSAGISTILAGRFLADHRRWTFCIVVAASSAFTCVPIGTVLGVLTFVVLLRPQVKRAFQERAEAAATRPGALGL